MFRRLQTVALASLASLVLMASTAFARSADDPLYVQGYLWGLHNTAHPGADIHAEAAWDITTGSRDVHVMIISPGVDVTHPDLVDDIWNNPLGLGGCPVGTHGYNTIAHSCDPTDDTVAGYGTHDAGIVGAVGNNHLGMTGVDWAVTIIPCKAFDREGNGTLESILGCLQLARTLKQQGVNLVLTLNDWSIKDGYSEDLRLELQQQMRADIGFVTKAGDNPVDQDNDYARMFPQDFGVDNIISVEATTEDDSPWPYSSHGSSFVALGAPGADSWSTAPGGGYAFMSGTEMAAAHVAGIAALLKAQDPSRDWRAIKNLILSAGDNDPALSSITNQTITGKRVNAYRSMTCQDAPVVHRLRPAGSGWTAVSVPMGTTLELSVLNINCAAPAGPVSVTLQPDNITIPLVGDQTNDDHIAGSGVYHALWQPTHEGSQTIFFPDGSRYEMNVLPSYTSSPVTFNWQTITGTNLQLGDDTHQTINLPFPITLAGIRHTTLDVDSNGRLSFGVAGYSDYHNIPLPNPAQEYFQNLFPFWDDLQAFPGTDKNVFVDVVGTAPHRELVIEYRNVSRASGCTDPNATIDFEVELYEDSESFQYDYANTAFGGPPACAVGDHGGHATIGWEGMFPAAVQVSYMQPSIQDHTSVRFTRVGAGGSLPQQTRALHSAATSKLPASHAARLTASVR